MQCHKPICGIKINKMDKNEKEILSLNEATIFLKMSKSCLYKITSQKQIPHYVPGGKKIYFKKSDLENWLLQNRVAPVSEFENSNENYLRKPLKSLKSC